MGTAEFITFEDHGAAFGRKAPLLFDDVFIGIYLKYSLSVANNIAEKLQAIILLQAQALTLPTSFLFYRFSESANIFSGWKEPF